MKEQKDIKRWMMMISGTIIAALGMQFLVLTSMGNATMTVFWDGMIQHLPITLGQASYITSILMIIFSLFYDRSQVQIGTIVHFIVYGLFLDLFALCIPEVSKMPYRIVYLVIGTLLLGIGIGIYAYAKLGRGPYEGICFALCEKQGFQMKYVRPTLDGIFMALGWLLGGHVGVVTVVNLVFCGYIIQKTTEALDHMFTQNRVQVATVKAEE